MSDYTTPIPSGYEHDYDDRPEDHRLANSCHGCQSGLRCAFCGDHCLGTCTRCTDLYVLSQIEKSQIGKSESAS